MGEIVRVRVVVPGIAKPIGRIVDGVEWRTQWRTGSGGGGEIVEKAEGPIWRATMEFLGCTRLRTEVYSRNGMSYYRAPIDWPLVDPIKEWIGDICLSQEPFWAWVKGHGNVKLNQVEIDEVMRAMVLARANGDCRKVAIHRLGTSLV